MGRFEPRRSGRFLALALALGSLFFADIAHAQEGEGPSVKGLRIVVPDARGKAAWGKAPLTKSVRRTLSEAIGPLIPSQKLADAQKKLKLKGSKKNEPSALAEAARQIDAQYVLTIEITKEKWLFTARALLINVETGEQQMDFRSQFYKPQEEADDRGKRIGSRAILKIQDLLKAAPPPFAGVASTEGEGARRGGSTREEREERETKSRDELEEPREQTAATPARKREESSTIASSSEPRSSPSSSMSSPPSSSSPSSSSSSLSSPPPSSSSGSNTSMSASSGGSSASGSSATMEIAPTAVEEGSEVFRVSVAGGAGILHTYDLSAAQVASSRLSYRLQPLAMINGEAEVVIPAVPIGVLTRLSWRPVHFEVNIKNEEPMTEPNAPSGFFLDATALLRAHLAVSGEGRRAFKLIPGAGIRYSMLTVAQHAGNIVQGSKSLAPIGSFAVRMPLNDVLELNIGIDGGILISYSESPDTSGTKDSGFVAGGDLLARIWLSSAVAIAFDTRFDFEKVSFIGTSSRQAPPNEELESVSVTTKDLRTGVGIAFRL